MGVGSLSIDVVQAEGQLVMRVGGELDGASAETFVRAVESLPPGADVVVDVHDLGFVDSAGLRALIETSARVRGSGARLRLEAPPPRLLRLLRLTDLDGLLLG